MRYFLLFLVLSSNSLFGQIAHYNQFPTLTHIRNDSILDSISFAFSMRQVYTDYQGPILKLRRASDNVELDFCKGTISDIVDIDSINSWRNGSNVFVSVWYDQSGMCRNAVQPTTTFQPQFIPDSARPYFVGDGTDDRLDVLTSIQTLTNAGVNGTVCSVIYATSKSQNTFGSLVGTNRWSAHINWSNTNLYFDPGRCCNNPRNFSNANNVWRQYSFIKTNIRVIVRRNSIQMLNGTHTTGACTINNTFGILYANGFNASFSTCRFTELIMYKYDIASSKYQGIENEQISFWNL